MDKILNLTNFPASPEQKEQGVIDCSEIDKIKKLLLFTHQPTAAEIRERAILIAHIASKEGCDKAMISGALYLMRPLQEELSKVGMDTVFAFSERQSVDKMQPDGTVKKENIFVHKGFVEANIDAGIFSNCKSLTGITLPNSTTAINSHEESVQSEQNSKVLNLTQHAATPDQVAAGVVEPKDKAEVQKYLTFDGIESQSAIRRRARALADIALENGCKSAMIGGAPYLMAALEEELSANGICPVYAFQERKVESVTLEDGSTKNNITFEHKGFIESDVNQLTFPILE